MSEFEKYIKAKYPNRSPKILFQKFKDIDGTVFYAVREIEDQAEVWSHQQAKIDRLNSVSDERTKEWLKKQLEIQQPILDISKPKLHKTDMGDCLHFSTTMFYEGKAECFDCGEVVNQARKIIGIKQALRGEQ